MEVRVLSPALALVLLALATSAAAALSSGWEAARPLPLARTEVAAARLGSEIAVIGGFLADGTSTGRVDAFSPRSERWRRLLDLPAQVNHAMVASASGGVLAPGRLAQRMLVLDLRTGRWLFAPGPSPREHLAVTAAGGIVYALAGRSGGTNFTTFEAYSPKRRTWRRLPPVPYPRGGTGAAVVPGRIVSLGGEEPGGTISSVFAYDIATSHWMRLPDMRTPRHGLGVVAFGARVYAIGGGPQPGLHVSAANEFLTLPK
ncbi:MAG: hypothetical protein E6G25_05370 [Actinobacteria bacterium]|nr:MAG: hypothetical protein E6G25_05370 [Actinomycetota bacterium]